MKRVDFRILIGAGLILMGALMFSERLGFFRGALDFFWGLVFIVAGAYFLYRFATNPTVDWWAAIPGCALAGLAAESLIPRMFGDWGGLFSSVPSAWASLPYTSVDASDGGHSSQAESS